MFGRRRASETEQIPSHGGVSQEVVDEILLLLPDLARALARSVPALARREDLSLAQIRALIHLRQAGPHTMSELAQALHISTPSATGLVDPLVERGLVERRRDHKDRRVVTVALTPEAEVLADRLVALRRHQIASALAGLDPEEQRLFAERLKRLAAALGGEVRLHT